MSDKPLSSDALAALQGRFQQQSRKAQAYYAVMHEARRVLGSDEAASVWMEAPLAALDRQTPAQLVAAGREQEVLEHVHGLKPAR
ncbi:antitoxin Xre/MbcA/ParS toxin-binding domain-containing protein [Massilia sp. Mn16-1_5]|uniref:antitoxin Xre/MbcA/ParS toxin-binding domain-containing protein n=1 Tax=Massilia sp. Mn16-1_5 TaxID=2079199 RepID=UPI00109E3D22|nr:antitoxin Xre/MbcA/ParS toxin-binding domain-containing protein [Massilia sp. Mn16-1_5]THC43603.1 hypothetical protein C2862_12455 [Massilia sp. Mn16-1_5]